jgi:hypothetical protein
MMATNSRKVLDPSVVGVFAGDAEATDMVFGSDGALYVLEGYRGLLQKISTSKALSESLSVNLKADKLFGPLPLTVRFDSLGSFDATGAALNYHWNLDGHVAREEGNSATAVVSFDTKAAKTIGLTVSNGEGSADAEIQVFPGYDLIGQIKTNASETGVFAGDIIQYEVDYKTEAGEEVPEEFMMTEIWVKRCTAGPPCKPDSETCESQILSQRPNEKTGILEVPDEHVRFFYCPIIP